MNSNIVTIARIRNLGQLCLILCSLCSLARAQEGSEFGTSPFRQSEASGLGREDNQDDARHIARALSAALSVVEKNYVKHVPRKVLLARAMKGILSNLDPYSVYFDPAEWNAFNSGIAGSFGGLGINMDIEPTSRITRIVRVFKGGAAQGAGLVPGDLIQEVDGQSTVGQTIEHVSANIRGKLGSKVRLLVRHPGAAEPIMKTLTRRVVKSANVRGIRQNREGNTDYLYDTQRAIGYVRITNMTADSVDTLKSALVGLEARHVRGVILDLRDNVGGYLSAATGCADLLLDAGDIVHVTGRGGEEKVYEAHPGTVSKAPMVVLINESTASSAEVLAACLQDNKRALLVGQRTYGKGYVQKLYPLGKDMGGIKLTTATFRRPTGKTLDRHDAAPGTTEWGVKPDPGMEVIVEGAEYEAWSKEDGQRDLDFMAGASASATDKLSPFRDRVLERALEALKSLLKD